MVKSGQDHRTIGQPGHRLHEHAGRAMRPGGPGHDDRIRGQVSAFGPIRDHAFRGKALARGAVGGIGSQKEIRRDAQKDQGILPVAGVIAGVDRLKRFGSAALGLHFGHQIGQRARQCRNRMTRGQIGAGFQIPGDQPCQFQPPRQRCHQRSGQFCRACTQIGYDPHFG